MNQRNETLEALATTSFDDLVKLLFSDDDTDQALAFWCQVCWLDTMPALQFWEYMRRGL